MSSEENEEQGLSRFQENIWNVLEGVNMDKQLKALYAFGKFYAEHHKMHNNPPQHECPECHNPKIVKEALEALQVVAATAYAMSNRLYSDEEDGDCNDCDGDDCEGC